MTSHDPKQSDPNAGGPEGLKGEMGVSSERTEFEGIEDTGTVGSTNGRTNGTLSTGPPRPEDGDPPREDNTAEVPAHPFDRTKNPGHSHG